jgi:FlaA1/EpsC-like NDP-sugar epimerase
MQEVDSKRRQIQINEWNYHDKMETLFIFQLTFLAFAVTIILLTLWKYGVLSRLYAIYTGATMLVIILIVGIIRRLYTKNVRNRDHWNGRNFEGDYSLSSLVPPAVLAATSTANQQVCDSIKGAVGASTKPVTISCP